MRYSFVCLTMFVCCSIAFAMECPDDEKFVRINSDQIGYNMYNKATFFDKAKECETCSEWKLTNKDKPNDLNIIGHAKCLNSEEFNKNAKAGPYCHCKIQEIDNYKVLSDWINVKLYENYVFDEDKEYSSEIAKKMEQNNIAYKNEKDCRDNCAKTCQSKLKDTIETVQGYYVCGKALYKLTNVICTLGDKLMKVTTIHIFDDVAEIKTEDDTIVFTKNTNDTMYVGKFEYKPVYLKVQGNSVYIGYESYSMEKCL